MNTITARAGSMSSEALMSYPSGLLGDVSDLRRPQRELPTHVPIAGQVITSNPIESQTATLASAGSPLVETVGIEIGLYAGIVEAVTAGDYEFPFVPEGRVSATAVEGHFPALDWEY